MKQIFEQQDNKEKEVNWNQTWYTGKLKETLAKSNLKQYPKRLYDEL